jgi:hypothetical protein
VIRSGREPESLGRTRLSVSVTQDENLSNEVFNSDAIFRSKHRASLYAALNFREPAHVCQYESSRGVEWYEDRPWSLAAFSIETSAASDRSLEVRSWRSREAPTREDAGEAMEGRHQAVIFSP